MRRDPTAAIGDTIDVHDAIEQQARFDSALQRVGH
jgi:hypothetical protein